MVVNLAHGRTRNFASYCKYLENFSILVAKQTPQAIEKFLALRDMEELRKLQLGQSQWNTLEICKKILAVRILSLSYLLSVADIITGTACVSAAPIC
jgi:hypothetical protein